MNYLFLDTQVFDANAYDFRNKHFRQIEALGKSRDVSLIMPEITRREIEKHIAAKAKEAHEAIEKFRRHGFLKNLRVPPFDAIAKGTTEEAIRAELMAHFNKFCEEANVTHLSAQELNVSVVLDDYFNQRPPFREGKKAREFPDAFTAQILITWCDKQSRKVFVVSGDGDWAAIVHPRLEILSNISQFLDRFPDPIIANQVRSALTHSSSFVEAIKEKFEETEFSDRAREAEIKNVEADNVELGNIYVIDISDDLATAEVDVHIYFSAQVEGRTRLRSYRYDDGYGDDDWVSGRINGTISTAATIEVYFAADDPSDIDLASVSLAGMPRDLDVSELFE